MMDKKFLLFVFFFLLVLMGCKNKEVAEEEAFKSYKSSYGFSFVYPTTFREADKSNNRIAFLDKYNNAILFIVNENVSSSDIMELGRGQAYSDFSDQQISADEIYKNVKSMKINGVEWFTYAMNFYNKELRSIVSGRLCGNKEVIVVLVTSYDSYEENRDSYVGILRSFEC